MPGALILSVLGKRNICPKDYELWKDARPKDFSKDQKITHERGWTIISGPEWKVFLIENLACGYTGRPKAVKRSFTKTRAASWAFEFGVKDVWTFSAGESQSEAETIEKEWDVGEIGVPEDDDECKKYKYQILYLIKVFAVEYYKNVTWTNGVWKYDRRARREAIADPLETAFVICRRCNERKQSYIPPDEEPSSIIILTTVIQKDGSVYVSGEDFDEQLVPDDSGFVQLPGTGEFFHIGLAKHPGLGKFVRI